MEDLSDKSEEYYSDEIYSDEYYDDESINEEIEISSKLLNHIQILQDLCGKDVAEIREIMLTSCVEADIHINILDILTVGSAKAWNIDPYIPINIMITLQANLFLSTLDPPKVEVYQKSRKEWFGLKFQLENILQKFLRNIWSSVQHGGGDEWFIPNQEDLIQIRGEIDPSYGFFYLIRNNAISRIRDLQKYCVICDEPHVFGMNNMLKQTVCLRPLCCFSYQQLGVAKNTADYLATSLEVIELLLKMSNIACLSNRKEVVVDPFPLLPHLDNPNKLFLDPDHPNYDKLVDILSVFPSTLMNTVAQGSFDEIKKYFDELNRYAFPLLQWVISSNRAHIVKLMPNENIRSMQTNEQYLMLSQPPEKEAKFQELKKKYPSTFAFHGSPIANWHSIVRKGLKNASGTKLQLHGAAYGKGIYLSTSSIMSLGYSNSNGYLNTSFTKAPNGKLHGLPTDLICMAVCEVIDYDIKKSGEVWVVEDEDKVCTRFLLVYSKSNPIPTTNCSSLKLQNDIRKAMEFYGIN